MQKFNIGIIGNGFVGNALFRGMKEHANICVYDTDEAKSLNSLQEVLLCEFIFLCVPTPQKPSGEIDNTYIDFCFDLITSNQFTLHPNVKVVIKSTVAPGTCVSMSKKYNMSVISNPEFLTERFAQNDFDNPRCILIGGDPQHSEQLQMFYETKFPKSMYKYFVTDSTSSELIKYTTNCFFAVKISFMNEIKQICNAVNANWNDVVTGFIADGRVHPQHLDVPGHDGLPGFGGKCLPKDLEALISLAESNDIIPTILKAASVKNCRLRTTT